MDIIDQAVYDLIHGFKRHNATGAPALSKFLSSRYSYSVAPGTLMNKANPEQPHQITAREGLLIQQAQNKPLLLQAEAHILNQSVVPLGDYSKTSDLELLSTYTLLHKEIGALATVIHDIFEDGKISRDEVRQVRVKIMALIRAALEIESRIKSLCDDRLEDDYFYE